MADQTQASLAGRTSDYDMRHSIISNEDRALLRGLAARIADLSVRPVEHEHRELWYRHNALEETRPLVFCDPENGWNEIITSHDLQCSGELARGWEMILRKELFWGESMGDDRVTVACFTLPYVYNESSWGMKETKIGGSDGGSYVWDSPLKSYNEMHKLRFPEITVDYKATDDLVTRAKDIFGDIVDVRLRGSWWWTLGMTWTLVNIRGLQQIMYDVYDNPDGLHKLMDFLRDGHLAKLQFLEDNNLLSLNNDGTYVGSGGFGWTYELPGEGFDGSKVRTCDMWGFSESQETVAWSPEMFAEFIFPYQLPILEKFGLNCYGCCEPLDKRWHIVEKIPRLRRVSVSPWADNEAMAEKLGDSYIFSLKPNPSYLAVPVMDESFVRADLRKTLKAIRNCRIEIIMKDNHTISNNPDNVVRWCRIAREEADSV